MDTSIQVHHNAKILILASFTNVPNQAGANHAMKNETAKITVASDFAGTVNLAKITDLAHECTKMEREERLEERNIMLERTEKQLKSVTA